MVAVPWRRATGLVEGPAYVAIGFGVLGFQRAQVLRRYLQSHPPRTPELGPEARELLDAASVLVSDLQHEARGLLDEAVPFCRAALSLLGPTSPRRWRPSLSPGPHPAP